MGQHRAYQLYAHITWHTWSRVGCVDQTIAANVRSVIARAGSRTGVRVLALAVLADHVHILITFRPDTRLSDFVRLAKCGSSIEANRTVPGALKWCRGFFAATLHKNELTRVRTYIAQQFEHHPDRVPRASRHT